MQKTGYTIDPDDKGWKLLAAAEDRLALRHNLADIVEIVRTTARAVCSADGVTFVLREGDRCHYVDEDAISPSWKGQRFSMAACICGWTMTNNATAAISDIFTDPRIPHDVYRRSFVKSLIMAPAGPAAAIGAHWRDERVFSSREIALVEALARAVGGAMATAQAA
ncbi:MAG TPA: GAF domain-containing protein [Rhizomicrobium sp.]|jgi:GAF domain-containing protein